MSDADASPSPTASKLRNLLQNLWKKLREEDWPTFKRDWILSWRHTKRYLKQHRWTILISLVVTLSVVIFYTWPNDRELLRALDPAGDKGVRKIAQEIGHTGSLAQYNFAIVIGFWLVGRIRKSRYLQRLAVTVLLTTILAGAFCNVFRFTVGRPRPWTGEDPNDLRGVQLEAKYHGHPSGHVSTAFGSAVPPLVCTPVVGVPITAYAVMMGWARMYNKDHYPSDVLVGTYIGTVFGLAGGIPLMRVRRRAIRIRKKT